MLVYVIDVWMDVGVLCFWYTVVLPNVLASYCENLFFSEVRCLWEFISLCFILWEFISPWVFLSGWVLSLFCCCVCLWCSNMSNYALFLKMFFWSNAEVCYFLARWVLVLKWKKVWLCDISLPWLCGLSLCQPKICQRGRLLGIWVLTSLLLKQILTYDVGYDVPTSWHGSVCPVCVAWFSRALSYEGNHTFFLVHQVMYFCPESTGWFVPKV